MRAGAGASIGANGRYLEDFVARSSPCHDTHHISFTREGMQLIREAARRQGSSASQFVREAALMRATMAADDNPYPMRVLAAQLRAIGDQGYALAEKALKVAEQEADRNP